LLSREERPARLASGLAWRERVVRYQNSGSRFVAREILLVGIAAAASFVFINHENLYLDHPFAFADARIESYILATTVLYLFLRLVLIAAEMRSPRVHAELVRCPECGQWIDDPTTAGLEAHRRIELTPKPSPKEIASAVALRRALEAARLGVPSAAGRRMDERTRAAPRPENSASLDRIETHNDPDFLERARHSPKPPSDPRLKR